MCLVSHRPLVLPAELAGLGKVRWSTCQVHSPCRAVGEHKACDTPVTTHGTGRGGTGRDAALSLPSDRLGRGLRGAVGDRAVAAQVRLGFI